MAAACSNGTVLVFRPKEVTNVESWAAESEFVASSNGVTAIAWSQCSYQPFMLAVGCCSKPSLDLSLLEKPIERAPEDLLQIWWLNEKTGKYESDAESIPENHKETIKDVAWAPFMGRSYHILLSCSMDCDLTFWKVNIATNKEGEMMGVKVKVMSRVKLEAIVVFECKE
eukprot:TRINITY_DN11271_c0_g1_i1.p1 TRINITY_DN11271_c0_g1~~TRINITY_DN11271_c0_g1_i1.p1  ORF type:complete len:170 (-),score=57.40 TRINITY_DN11271_c0_g1_i1:138-647(-)